MWRKAGEIEARKIGKAVRAEDGNEIRGQLALASPDVATDSPSWPLPHPIPVDVTRRDSYGGPIENPRCATLWRCVHHRVAAQ